MAQQPDGRRRNPRHPTHFPDDWREPEHALAAGCLVLDAKGFVKTGADLDPAELTDARWPVTHNPYLLETSHPGVFAVGDVRAGNIKRVATAVGEGSIGIHLIHKVLQEWSAQVV